MHQCCSGIQAENSLACQCNHTYQFLHLTQLFCISAEMHSTQAWDPVHVQCTSAALEGKLKTVLLVSAITPISFCTSHSSSAYQQRCTALRPGTLSRPTVFVASAHSAALTLFMFRQAENSLACQCNHTYQFLHLTQLFCISAEMHSTQAWNPVTVFVASAPVLLWKAS